MQKQGETGVPKPEREPVSLLDVALGVASQAVATVGAVGRGFQSLAEPIAHAVLQPPIIAPRWHPATWLSGVARRGSFRRGEVEQALAEVLDVIVPRIAAAVVRRLDLTELVTDHVDIDRILLQVDLDTAASRLDIDAVASRLDIEAVVGRLDLTEIARRGLDLNGLVAIVDLDAAAARLDIDAVIDRIDLVGLAREVMAEIDLPEIIRESTGSVASDTLRGVRMQSISGDDAIARAVERLRLRRARRTAAPTSPKPVPPAEESIIAPSPRSDSAARTT